ncbi:ribonuclease H-like domain-containing protein [Aspergillus spinulosporus]
MKRLFSDQSESRIPLAAVDINDSGQNVLQNKNVRTTPWKQDKGLPVQSSKRETCQYWSHRLYKTEEGNPITVHYCKSLATAEKVAEFFLNETVLGFDMEWQATATTYSSIQENISTIQLASRNRIAIFHIARFMPNLKLDDLMPPKLKSILENPEVTKTGVNIRADYTRLRKYLGINARGTFELSHLYKLIKYCHTSPRLINKHRVRLADQVQEHLGLPLAKGISVRCSNWQKPITAQQAHYAAADAYASYQLFVIMDAKRRALDPVPPLPAHDELNLPIRTKEESVPVEESVSVNKITGNVRHVKMQKTKTGLENLLSAKASESALAIRPDDSAFEIVKRAETPRERTQSAEPDETSDFETMETVKRLSRSVQHTDSADNFKPIPVKGRVGRSRKPALSLAFADDLHIKT